MIGIITYISVWKERRKSESCGASARGRKTSQGCSMRKRLSSVCLRNDRNNHHPDFPDSDQPTPEEAFFHSNLAILAPQTAIALIIISIFLTFIAGLIPSGLAAKRDPVIALRTDEKNPLF